MYGFIPISEVTHYLTQYVYPHSRQIKKYLQMNNNMEKNNNFDISTSRIFSICSLHPPTSLYVTSGFSSTVIIVTLGSIFGGKGIWI
jgi:hypothetical protein